MTKPRNPQDKERQAQMVASYRDGQTLEEIGQAHGVSRERVRQLIAAAGITRKDGGLTVRAARNDARKATEKHARRDKRTVRFYGCSYAEARLLNDMQILSRVGSLAQVYIRQRQTASSRGIDWAITFPEWVKVWRDSGRLSERGKGASGYCMARAGDVGPYAINNVYITTIADNVRDYQSELKVRGVVCSDGYKRLPEFIERISTKQRQSISRLGAGRGFTVTRRSKKRPYQVVVGNEYIGVYATEQEAVTAYKEAVSVRRHTHGQ